MFFFRGFAYRHEEYHRSLSGFFILLCTWDFGIFIRDYVLTYIGKKELAIMMHSTAVVYQKMLK